MRVSLVLCSVGRNAELIAYQSQLRKMRQQYCASLRDQPTKSQQACAQKEQKRAAADAKWKTYIQKVQNEYANPASVLYGSHHPCRPRVVHAKTPGMRAERARSLDASLARLAETRRRHVKYLDGMVGGFVTRANLDAKVKYALEHPVSHNTAAESIIAQEQALKMALAALKL